MLKLKKLAIIATSIIMAASLCSFIACSQNVEDEEDETIIEIEDVTPELEEEEEDAEEDVEIDWLNYAWSDTISYQFEATCSGHSSYLLLSLYDDGAVKGISYGSHGNFEYYGNWTLELDKDEVGTMTVNYTHAYIISSETLIEYSLSFSCMENLNGEYIFNTCYQPLIYSVSSIYASCDGKGTATSKIYYDVDEWYNDYAVSSDDEAGESICTFVDSTNESNTIEFYEDGTAVVTAYSGALSLDFYWTYDEENGLVITQQSNADNVFVATIDGTSATITYTLASYGISITYACDDITALTTEATPTVYGSIVDGALVFSSSADTMTLTINADGTWSYVWDGSYQISEEGTWTNTTYSLTLTQSNDATITSSMDMSGTMTISYVAVRSSQITCTFTCSYSVWAAFIATLAA